MAPIRLFSLRVPMGSLLGRTSHISNTSPTISISQYFPMMRSLPSRSWKQGWKSHYRIAHAGFAWARVGGVKVISPPPKFSGLNIFAVHVLCSFGSLKYIHSYTGRFKPREHRRMPWVARGNGIFPWICDARLSPAWRQSQNSCRNRFTIEPSKQQVVTERRIWAWTR